MIPLFRVSRPGSGTADPAGEEAQERVPPSADPDRRHSRLCDDEKEGYRIEW